MGVFPLRYTYIWWCLFCWVSEKDHLAKLFPWWHQFLDVESFMQCDASAPIFFLVEGRETMFNLYWCAMCLFPTALGEAKAQAIRRTCCLNVCAWVSGDDHKVFGNFIQGSVLRFLCPAGQLPVQFVGAVGCKESMRQTPAVNSKSCWCYSVWALGGQLRRTFSSRTGCEDLCFVCVGAGGREPSA